MGVGFLLYPWEAARLYHRAVELDVPIRLVPRHSIYSLKAQAYLVTHYVLYLENCPFFDPAKKCKIYEDRPLICRSFPLNNAGIYTALTFGKCPKHPAMPQNMNGLHLKKFMPIFHEMYGESYTAAVKMDLTRYIYQTFLKDLTSLLGVVNFDLPIHQILTTKVPFADLFYFLHDNQIPYNSVPLLAINKIKRLTFAEIRAQFFDALLRDKVLDLRTLVKDETLERWPILPIRM